MRSDYDERLISAILTLMAISELVLPKKVSRTERVIQDAFKGLNYDRRR
jgi:hypothetical protein